MTEEPLHPLAAQVSKDLQEPSSPFMMLVYLVTKPGEEQALIDAFQEPLRETVEEKGNFTYRLIQQSSHKENFIVVEHWQDLDSLDAHLKQTYLKKLGEQFADILKIEPQVDVYQEIIPQR